jgi:hypothetical protein
MFANLINNLGAIANMKPIGADVTFSNIGANASLVIYTVPTDKVTAIDWVFVTVFSGTLPGTINITTTGMTARLHRSIPAINIPVFISNTIWLPAGSTIRVQTTGGDATTDVITGLIGREFQYTQLAV